MTVPSWCVDRWCRFLAHSQHFLCFLPESYGHGSFRPVFPNDGIVVGVLWYQDCSQFALVRRKVTQTWWSQFQAVTALTKQSRYQCFSSSRHASVLTQLKTIQLLVVKSEWRTVQIQWIMSEESLIKAGREWRNHGLQDSRVKNSSLLQISEN